MARITVEDCIDKFPSRFELVLIASNRARKLHSGETPTVEVDNDKNTVIALREISEETLTTDQLKDDLIAEYQNNPFSEDDDINELEDNSDENQSELNKDTEDEIKQKNLDLDHDHVQVSDNLDQNIEEKSSTNSEVNLEVSSNGDDQDKVQDL